MEPIVFEGKFGKSLPLVWINFAACGLIFCEGVQFGHTALGDIKLQYFFAYPLLLALMFYLRGLFLNRIFTVCLIALSIATFWNVLHGKDQPVLMFKIMLGFFQNAALYYMVLKANDFKVMPLFRTYLSLCIPVAIFGLIQEAAFLLGITPLYDLSWLIPDYHVGVNTGIFIRLHSILPEPTFFDFAITPAVFAAVHSWLDPKHRLMNIPQSLIISVAFIFSFSTVGYLGLAVSLLLMMINFRRFFYVISISLAIPILAIIAYNLVPDVHKRVDDALALTMGTGELETTDISNLALFSNMHVALESFSENPWIGSGLGSHPVSYDRYIGNVVNLDQIQTSNDLLLNREDASSLLLRLISETGMLGLGLFLIFIFGNRLSKKRDLTGQLWVINNGIFSLMILMLLRFGNYFSMGSFLFFWLLYSSKREAVHLALDQGTESTSVIIHAT